ncbi:MAG: UDP-N-acetylmuramate dehydrogenase [Elusimicrobia bacterium]|nr:UDP-N-acetylmuramate dehydrogenase [Elusimicrobiota bacterium]
MENRRRNIRKDLASQISSIVSSLKLDEPLKKHTTFKIGGPARYFVEAANKKEIQNLWNFTHKERLPLFVLGGGSNILVSDRGFDGVVVRLTGEFKDFVFQAEKLVAGCGVSLAKIVNECVQRGLSGIEYLAGIPGTLGGAIVGNAGSSDAWIEDIINSVKAINENGQIAEILKKDILFRYRVTNLEKKVLLESTLNLKKSTKNDIVKKIKENTDRRLESQPIESWNAGSIFKNPQGDYAGRLIEQAGLKGLKFGGAKISEKHANFIINSGDAKSSDVLELIKVVRHKVKEKFGIDLELEIKIIG